MRGARERCGLGLGKRQDVDRRLVAGDLEVLLDRLGDGAEDAAEGVELDNAHVVVTRRDGQLPALLRVEDALLEDGRHVALAVERLDLVQGRLHGNFLDEEAVERGLNRRHELRNLVLGV